MTDAADYIKKWHEVILEGKMELLDNLLNDNATFYSPVVLNRLKAKKLQKCISVRLVFHSIWKL